MNIHYLICLIILLASCSGKGESNLITEEKTSPPDNITPVLADTLETHFQYSDFTVFYERFISDSAYQMEHIHFPMKGNYQDYDTVIPWTKTTWPLITFDIRKKEGQSDSTSLIEESNLVFFGTYCLDCGFSFEMEFQKKNAEWFLVYRQENGF